MACLRRFLPARALDEDSDPFPAAILNRLEITPDDFLVALRDVEPSAIREVFVERPNVGWQDVGGLDLEKQRLLEVVAWPLTHASLLAKAGVKPPRGVLLTGPPGCGKTLLARAVASETGVNFLSVKGPELLSQFVGESERAVREVFHKARQAAPCLVFFDEIDALLTRRGSGSSDDCVGDRVLGQFLAEIDGVESLEGVLILGATNRPDRLDPALLRPGRFEVILNVPLPCLKAREAIARIALKNKPVEMGMDTHALAAATEGFSGAEVQSAVARAAMTAVRVALNQGEIAPILTTAGLAQAVEEIRKAKL